MKITGKRFLVLENNFLILDGGTAPDSRKIIFYNLTKREEVFSDKYSKPTIVHDDTIDY